MENSVVTPSSVNAAPLCPQHKQERKAIHSRLVEANPSLLRGLLQQGLSERSNAQYLLIMLVTWEPTYPFCSCSSSLSFSQKQEWVHIAVFFLSRSLQPVFSHKPSLFNGAQTSVSVWNTSPCVWGWNAFSPLGAALLTLASWRHAGPHSQQRPSPPNSYGDGPPPFAWRCSGVSRT